MRNRSTCHATKTVQVANQPLQVADCHRTITDRPHDGWHAATIYNAAGRPVEHRWFDTPLAIRKEQDRKA